MDRADPSTSRIAPLNETEERAWFATMALFALGLPQVERTFRDYGLVYIEYLLLRELAAAPQGLRMTELAGCIQASPSRLSHRIRKLADVGYVEQERDTADGRGTIAVITRRGSAVVDELTPAHLADLRQLVFDHLSPAQVEAFADVMTTIALQLKETGRDRGTDGAMAHEQQRVES